MKFVGESMGDDTYVYPNVDETQYDIETEPSSIWIRFVYPVIYEFVNLVSAANIQLQSNPIYIYSKILLKT